MKQVVQSLSRGPVRVIHVPRPTIDASEVLVQTVASIISSGTDRAVTAVAESSLLAKARAQPSPGPTSHRPGRSEGIPLMAIAETGLAACTGADKQLADQPLQVLDEVVAADVDLEVDWTKAAVGGQVFNEGVPHRVFERSTRSHTVVTTVIIRSETAASLICAWNGFAATWMPASVATCFVPLERQLVTNRESRVPSGRGVISGLRQRPTGIA